MKKFYLRYIYILLAFLFVINARYPDNFTQAENYIRKAKTTSVPEESYEYLHKARILYLEEYEKNPLNIKALLGMSTVNQMLKDRSEA